MKRYNHIPIDINTGCIVYGGRVQEIEAEDGEWVRYEDIKECMRQADEISDAVCSGLKEALK